MVLVCHSGSRWFICPQVPSCITGPNFLVYGRDGRSNKDVIIAPFIFKIAMSCWNVVTALHFLVCVDTNANFWRVASKKLAVCEFLELTAMMCNDFKYFF